MTQEKDSTDSVSQLRTRAEEMIHSDSLDQQDITQLSTEEIERLIHELRVHQIELEMQNENLLQAQQQMERQKERYLDLYDFAPVGYVTLNDKGLILEANLTAIRLLGVERANLIKKFFSQFVSQESANVYYSHLKKVFASQSEQTCDIELRRKDGTVFHAQLASVAVHGVNRLITHCRTILSDISERKRLEDELLQHKERLEELVNQRTAELRNSELKFRTFADFTFDWEYWIRPDGSLVYVSPSCERITGYRPEEFFNNPKLLSTIIHPADLSVVGYHFDIIGSGDPCSMDFRIVTRTGEERWISHACQVIFDKTGQWLGRRGSNRDMTETKKLEKQLLQSGTNFDTFFNAIDDLLFVLDPRGRITHVNDTVLHRLGFTKDELIGQSVLDVHPIERRDEAERIVAEMLEGKAKFCPIPVVSKDGRQIPVETRVVKGEWDGKPALFGVTKDITQIKRSEEKFSSAFHSSPVSMAISRSQDGCFIDVNEAFLNTLGFSRQEVIGKTSSSLNMYADIADRDKIRCMFEDDGKVRDAEILFRRSDGTLMSGLLSVEAISIDDESCWLATMVDINERKLAEAALLKNRELLALAIEGSGVGTWDWNVQTGETAFNDRWAQIIGYTLEELEPVSIDTWIRHCHPDDLKKSGELLQKHFAGETSVYECEARMKHKDGHWVWVLDRGKVTESDSDGKPVRVTGTHLDITSRKQMEQALWASEERHRVLFEKANDAILIIGLEGDDWGRIVDANQVAARMHGYEREELRNLKITDLDTPEFAENFAERAERLLQGKWIQAEIVHRRKDGSFFPIEISVGLVEFGNKKYALSFERDISERKQADECLHESEERFRNLFERHAAVMLLVDPNSGAIVDANPAASNYYGYPREVIRTMHIQDINSLPPDEVHAQYQQAAKENRNYFVFPHRLSSGEVRTVEVHSSPIDVRGQKLLFSIVHDITERKRLEEELQQHKEYLEELVDQRTAELRESELHFKNLVEYAGDAIFVYDRDVDRIVDCNQRACDGLGYTRDELLQMPISDVEVNFDKEQIRSITGALRPGEAITVDGKHRRKDGSTFPVEARIGIIAQTGSDTLVGIVRDVTERTRAAQEKEDLQKQLLHSQKMEAIGTLAGGIAHDFNNILFAITGYGELALDDVPEDSFAYKNIRLALSAADRAADLTRHILTFSRETEQQKDSILISPILKESLKFLRASLPADVEIRSTIGGELQPVYADPTQMHQVFMNLLTNAAYAMKDAGGVLAVGLDEVCLTKESGNTVPGIVAGTYQRLKVSDTGHGMVPEVLERIFDPFFTTKEPGQGTGLGLSVIDGIVRNHGGFINVNSTPGEGTTFEVFFPVVTDILTFSGQTTELVAPIGTGRILLVDDEQMITEATGANLEKLGYEVITHNDPMLALAAFEASPDSFDLIITDIGMPNMSGFQLSKRIREIRTDIPIVAITGYADLVEQDLLDSGIHDWIYKPIKRSDIAQTLARVLSKQES